MLPRRPVPPASRVLVTPPGAEPLTLAEAKSHAQVINALHDADVSSYIVAARMYLEERCRRHFVQQVWDLKWDEFPEVPGALDQQGQRTLALTFPPIISVGSVSYVDSDGITQVWSAADYQVVLHGGQTPRPGEVLPAFGKAWPTARQQPLAVIVRCTCGYGALGSDVPGPILSAMRLLVTHMYEVRTAEIVGTITKKLDVGLDAILAPFTLPEV